MKLPVPQREFTEFLLLRLQMAAQIGINVLTVCFYTDKSVPKTFHSRKKVLSGERAFGDCLTASCSYFIEFCLCSMLFILSADVRTTITHIGSWTVWNKAGLCGVNGFNLVGILFHSVVTCNENNDWERFVALCISGTLGIVEACIFRKKHHLDPWMLRRLSYLYESNGQKAYINEK